MHDYAGRRPPRPGASRRSSTRCSNAGCTRRRAPSRRGSSRRPWTTTLGDDRGRPAVRREGRRHGPLADGRRTVTGASRRTGAAATPGGHEPDPHRRAPAAPRRGAQPGQDPLRPAAGLPALRDRSRPGRHRREGARRRRPDRRARLAAATRAGDRRTGGRAARPADRHRRPADRGREQLRGQAGRGRRRRAAQPAVLVAAARPVHAVVGRAVPADRAPHARRRAPRPRARRRARGAVRRATSCRSGRCAASSPAGGCGTTRGGGSARWPR